MSTRYRLMQWLYNDYIKEDFLADILDLLDDNRLGKVTSKIDHETME